MPGDPHNGKNLNTNITAHMAFFLVMAVGAFVTIPIWVLGGPPYLFSIVEFPTGICWLIFFFLELFFG